MHGNSGALSALFSNMMDISSESSYGPPSRLSPRPTYEPTVADVMVTRMLIQRGAKLPPEIVNAIIDMAEYWPHSTTEVDYLSELARPIEASGSRATQNRFLVRLCFGCRECVCR